MKNELIKQVRDLLDPRPNFLLFRAHNFNNHGQASNGLFEFQGNTLTREECLKIPAKKHIFVQRQHKVK